MQTTWVRVGTLASGGFCYRMNTCSCICVLFSMIWLTIVCSGVGLRRPTYWGAAPPQLKAGSGGEGGCFPPPSARKQGPRPLRVFTYMPCHPCLVCGAHNRIKHWRDLQLHASWSKRHFPHQPSYEPHSYAHRDRFMQNIKLTKGKRSPQA